MGWRAGCVTTRFFLVGEVSSSFDGDASSSLSDSLCVLLIELPTDAVSSTDFPFGRRAAVDILVLTIRASQSDEPIVSSAGT